MAGNYYRHHHPGGISAVVQYWSKYIEGLQYYPTWKLGNVMVRAWWFGYSYFRIALRLLYDKRIKIVHLHFAADGSFWRKEKLLKLGKFFGKKVIMHCHSSRFKDFYNESSVKKRNWIKETLLHVDLLIVLSKSWKQWFKEIGIPENKIVVLHNITPNPTIIPSAKINEGRIKFLFLGEIGKRKGVFDIIRGITTHHSDLQGKIELRIGGNKNEEELKRQIKENGLQDVVKFEGWVGGKKKLELLNWADVFILPSFNEGLPISILEAMSYGMPIISTPVGGIPEVVKNGVNGIIVTPGNSEEIISAMQKYICKPERIRIEGEESKKLVKGYLPQDVLMHLKNIYEDFISK